ncbi:hypothetical protein GCM10010472_10840 [Pseudonocardia halophobica]|uniref:Uncharacterized protein n=1 Tax=Pseudonocardia halophobica TaxID=29401 RepID=A0A9W6L4E9_9PSEU|nr:hypothetical protein [Pseudonocardia halophobica]GLL13471.1 hypothetical protein GCM10017577_46150 [Pseudonocardia halophobica]
MATVHGKSGSVLLATKDCSAFCNSIEFEQTADDHDVTTFGATGHVYAGGLTDGSVKLAGIYDNTALTGPRAAVQAVLGTTVALKYRPEGVGTGKPESSCQVLVKSYKESVPVDEMISWEAELTISGAVTVGAQV